MPSLKVLIAKRFNSLPRSLQVHMNRTRILATELAERHGVDTEPADLAASTHDLLKGEPDHVLLQMAEEYGVEIDPIMGKRPTLLHGPVAAAWMEIEGGLDDRRVADAVRWHTFGWAQMDGVGKVVYIADKVEPWKVDADPGLAPIRELADSDLDAAIIALLEKRAAEFAVSGKEQHPKSIELLARLKG